MIEMDPEAVKTLARQILEISRGHLAPPPHHRAKVFEMLQALAVAAGPLIAGSGDDIARVRTWFDVAVDEAVEDCQQ
jgi:hypothetical protein